MNEVNTDAVPNTPKGLDFNAVAQLLHTSLQFLRKIADLRGWTQVVGLIDLVDGFVSDPQLVALLLSVIDLFSKVTKQEVVKMVTDVLESAKK